MDKLTLFTVRVEASRDGNLHFETAGHHQAPVEMLKISLEHILSEVNEELAKNEGLLFKDFHIKTKEVKHG